MGHLMMSHVWHMERGVSCLYKGQPCTDIRWFVQGERKAPVTIIFDAEIYWYYEKNYAGLCADIFHVALLPSLKYNALTFNTPFGIWRADSRLPFVPQQKQDALLFPANQRGQATGVDN